MELECVIYDKQDGVAVIRLNRPKVLNAMNKRLWLDMQAALEDARADEGIKVVVVTGEGRAFSTLKPTGITWLRSRRRHEPSFASKSPPSPRSTASPSGPDTNWPWPATSASPPRRPRSAAPRPK